MSRQRTITGSVKLIPNSYTDTGSYHFTHQTVTNAYTDADSTTNNRMTLARNRNSVRLSEIYYEFDKSELANIPSNATITSIAANVKYYVSSTTYVTAVSIQLRSNTTAKGSAVTGRTTTATKYSITPGTWTLSELENIRLYVSATHSASNTNAYLYFYGADVTVNYSYSATEYEVAMDDESATVTTDPSISVYVLSGGEQEIKFYNIDDPSNVSVKDNGTDVTLSEHRPLTPQTPVTLNPSTFIQAAGGISGETNALTDTTSTTYAQIHGQYTNYMIYGFDVSQIPQNAVINSIACSAKVQHTRTTASGEVQLYSGSDAKGSVSTFGNTATVVNLTPGTWTRAELENIRIRVGNTYNGGTTTYYTRFYGANLVINYSIPGGDIDYYTYTISNISADHTIVISDVSSDKMYMKVNGNWVGLQKVYKKVSNSWVEQTDLTNVFDPNQIYVRN